MSSIKIDTSQLETFNAKVKAKASDSSKFSKVIKKSTFNIERKAKENITKNGNVKTGQLRRSVASKVTLLDGEVNTSNLNHAIIIEKGSKPHIIRAKNKKMLYWQGASRPVKQVRHPGTKPYPFLVPALESEKDEFVKGLKEAIKFE